MPGERKCSVRCDVGQCHANSSDVLGLRILAHFDGTDSHVSLHPFLHGDQRLVVVSHVELSSVPITPGFVFCYICIARKVKCFGGSN
jgi:hypothetical protein